MDLRCISDASPYFLQGIIWPRSRFYKVLEDRRFCTLRFACVVRAVQPKVWFKSVDLLSVYVFQRTRILITNLALRHSLATPALNANSLVSPGIRRHPDRTKHGKQAFFRVRPNLKSRVITLPLRQACPFQ